MDETFNQMPVKRKSRPDMIGNQFRKGLSSWNKGLKGAQIAWNKGKEFSAQARINMSKAQKGKPHPWNLGKIHTKETRAKISEAVKVAINKPEIKEKLLKTAKENYKLKNARILKEAEELEKQGFRVIPITRVIPDIIALKDNKVFAVEVEYKIPNYTKYTADIQRYFDDVIWILRGK